MNQDDYDDRPLPAKPTRHWPGTRGKIRVMRKRRSRGEALWHPLDARIDSTTMVRVPVLFSNNKLSRWSVSPESECRKHKRCSEFVAADGISVGQTVSIAESIVWSPITSGRVERIIKDAGEIRVIVRSMDGLSTVTAPISRVKPANCDLFGDPLDN